MSRSRNNSILVLSVRKVRWTVTSDELSGAACSDTATRRVSSWLKSKKIASDFITMSKCRLFSGVSGTQSACNRFSNAVIIQGLQIPFILFLCSCIPSGLLFQEFPRLFPWEWPVKYWCHFSEKRRINTGMYPWISSVTATIRQRGDTTSIIRLSILETLKDTLSLEPLECHYMLNTFWYLEARGLVY